MCVALDVQEENHSGPIDRKLIAQALQKRNFLRVAESIQISPNGRFCSIKFTTTQIISIFCTEPLTISENNYIVFKPDYKPPQTRAFIFISFLNVPLETEETEMTRYVKEYCDVHGVHYPKQHIGDITYHTGTRVYRCSNIKEHFPKAVHIFVRWVRVIYDEQPDSKRKPNNATEVDEQNESAQQNDQPSHTTPELQTITEETPESQLPIPTAINEITQNETQPTTNTTLNNVPHLTMDLTIDDFPTLTTDEIDNQSTPDKNDFSDDSMDQSPAVTSNQPLQTTFKRPREATSDSEDHLNNRTLTKEQRNTAIYVCRELHRYSFRNVDKLQNLNTDKKRRIISKAIFIELGDYDPSNEYIVNYFDSKTIRLYRKLTEKRIDIETLYSQIYNQLTKNEKPKRTKHNDSTLDTRLT